MKYVFAALVAVGLIGGASMAADRGYNAGGQYSPIPPRHLLMVSMQDTEAGEELSDADASCQLALIGCVDTD